MNIAKVLGAEGIYAIGDVACMNGNCNGHPGVAQVAIQMGTFLREKYGEFPY